MGVITLELRPGVGLGTFMLGMPVCEALAAVEAHRHLFATVHLKYSQQDPLQRDLVLSFPENGFHMRFEPTSQRLRLLEVFDLTRLQMRYAASLVGGPSVAATFVRLYAIFGPTFPGAYDNKRSVYSLLYPGLSFRFPIPSQYSECCLQREADLPLEFPDGTTPVASRMCIYAGGVNALGSIAKALPPPLPAGSLYMEPVHAKLAEGLYFEGGRQSLPFGAAAQDVWAELGRPCCIYPKGVDPMLIHSAGEGRAGSTALCGDYFYNYCTRGIDILFDGQTHRIKKFVLHTNFPGHLDFNTYVKCNFSLDTAPGLAVEEGEGSAEVSHERLITADSKWEQVQAMLGDGGRAAIQTRGSTSNPFGPTFVYGYCNVAFEVMKNGHIASVTLFQSQLS